MAGYNSISLVMVYIYNCHATTYIAPPASFISKIVTELSNSKSHSGSLGRVLEYVSADRFSTVWSRGNGNPWASLIWNNCYIFQHVSLDVLPMATTFDFAILIG